MAAPETDNPSENEKEQLHHIYAARGFQQQALEDYLTVKKMQDQRKSFRIPAALKIFLATPIILLFCMGLFFIPFMMYLLISSGR